MKLFALAIGMVFPLIASAEGLSSKVQPAARLTYEDLRHRIYFRPYCGALLIAEKISPSITITEIARTGVEACIFDSELTAALDRDERAVCPAGDSVSSPPDCVVDFYRAHGQSATSLVLSAAAIHQLMIRDSLLKVDSEAWRLRQLDYFTRLLEVTDLRLNPALAYPEQSGRSEVTATQRDGIELSLNRIDGMLKKLVPNAEKRGLSSASLTPQVAALEARVAAQRQRILGKPW